jgi:hypothetical protein
MDGGCAEVDRLLIDGRLNLNCKEKHGNTPLWWATQNCSTNVTKRLLAEQYIDINSVGRDLQPGKESTALQNAEEMWQSSSFSKIAGQIPTSQMTGASCGPPKWDI